MQQRGLLRFVYVLYFHLNTHVGPLPPTPIYSDNLTDYHLEKTGAFVSEHKERLAGVEAATSSFAAAPITDAAVS